jgi:hypothetical protein
MIVSRFPCLPLAPLGAAETREGADGTPIAVEAPAPVLVVEIQRKVPEARGLRRSSPLFGS